MKVKTGAKSSDIFQTSVMDYYKEFMRYYKLINFVYSWNEDPTKKDNNDFTGMHLNIDKVIWFKLNI
jgi:hypothetical protein